MLKRILLIQTLLAIIFCGVISAQNDSAIKPIPVSPQDSTIEYKRDIAELRKEFYDWKSQELDRDYSGVNIMLTIIGLLVVLIGGVAGYTFYSAKVSRNEVEIELEKIKKYGKEVEETEKEYARRRKRL